MRERLSRTAVVAVLSFAVASLLAAQEAIRTGRATTQTAVIRISVTTGFLRVSAWDRDSLDVRGRADPEAGRFYIGGTREAIKLGLEPPDSSAASGTSDLEIRIPAGAHLWVKSAAADVEITAGGGSVEVIGVSGRVRIAGRATEISAETLDGNIEVAAEAGVARVRTASGIIVVRGRLTDLDASAVSGPLLIGMESPIGRVRLETVSSDIAFKGDLLPAGRLQAETHGGDIELRLPPALGAAYHLVSFGGGISNEMVPPGAVRAGPGKGEWTFRTGDGGATVEVRTFKGRVSLKPKGP